MSKLLISVLLATLAPSSVALVLAVQATRPPTPAASSDGQVRSIDVDGKALITVVPDKATMTFIVETTGATREAAQAAADARIEKALAALVQAGVAPVDLRTEGAALSPEYARDAHGQPLYLEVRRWTATRQLTVCTHDLGMVARLQRAAQGAGARVTGNVLFETSQMESLQAEARLQAARAARLKATAMVEALGGRLGGPLAVRDSVGSAPASYGAKNTSDDRTEGTVGVLDGDFAAGKLSITAQVAVSFEILRGT